MVRVMSDPTIIEDDAYTMANLRPADTGLPMVVWVSERGNARHDVRVKVCRVHGDKIQYSNTVSMAVRPQPHLVEGQLSQADIDLVSLWITINAKTIVAYWDGDISTSELLQQLIPVLR
jgi:hypothetical protein